jgi:hypothetical protein
LKDQDIEKNAVFTFRHTDVAEKAKRTQIHQFFKGSQFESDTIKLEDQGGSKIRVFLGKELSKNKRRKMNIMACAPNKDTGEP